jgi:hypothetical protein
MPEVTAFRFFTVSIAPRAFFPDTRAQSGVLAADRQAGGWIGVRLKVEDAKVILPLPLLVFQS